jgi:hypothetical protein
MKKLLAIIAILGLWATADAQVTPPKIQLLGTTANSLAIKITAGSDGTPDGFQLYWQTPQGTCQATFIPELCPQYALAPGASIVIIVGVGQCSGCHIDNCYGILCSTTYALWVVAGGQQSAAIYASTQLCPPGD